MNKQIKMYQELNRYAQENEIVLFGADFFHTIPAGELAESLGVNGTIMNRSLSELRICDAEKLMADIVYPLRPKKLFINLGEVELAENQASIADLLSSYEWMLYQTHMKLPQTKLYLTSVVADGMQAEAFNKGLKKLAKESGCQYIDLMEAGSGRLPEVRAFARMRQYFRDAGMNLSDAFNFIQV